MMVCTTRRLLVAAALAVTLSLPACGGDGGSSSGGSSSGASSSGAAKSGFVCQGKAEIGKPAPPFELDSVNDVGKVTIPRGKVTLVDFWATWCEPCRASFPKYQELYVKYKASGLEIAALSVDADDEKKAVPKFVTTHGAKFPVGWDEGKKIADCYQLPGMPTAFLVDKNGVVQWTRKGFKDGEEKDLEKKIRELL